MQAILNAERYTERARRVLFFARHEAIQHGGAPVEPEHLLLALIHADPELFRLLSHSSNDAAAEVQARIESVLELHPASYESGPIPPFSRSAEQSLNLAAVHSNKLNHNYVGTEHVLLGLLAHTSTASKILIEAGFTIECVATKIANGSITPQNGHNNEGAILEGRIIGKDT